MPLNPTWTASVSPGDGSRRHRVDEVPVSSRAAVPRDTDLSTPNASIDAISVGTRLQCVKSWLRTVTERG